MINIATITQFLSGGVFLLAGVSLRKAKAFRSFPLFFWFLAIASYLWGIASLLQDFGFMLEGYIPVPLGGLFYLLALIAVFVSLYFITSLLFDLLKPSFKEFILRVFLLWGAVMLFLVATHLPYPTWSGNGLVQWNLQTGVAIALGIFTGLFSIINTVMLLILAAEAQNTRLKFRGFLLAIGLIMYSFSAGIQYFPINFQQYLFVSTVTVLGSGLMFWGINITK